MVNGLPFTADLVIQGVVGLLIAGAVFKAYMAQRVIASTSLRAPDPIVSAVTIGWSLDQVERLLQAAERIADAADTYDEGARNESARAIKLLMQKLEGVEITAKR